MKTSTNALAQRFCAFYGWPCETVQRFYGGRRHDLFGIGDSLIIRGTNVVVVQNCSYGTMKEHRDAIDRLSTKSLLLSAGIVLELWEWRRKKAKRGGKRIAREWYMRWSRAIGDSWSPVSDWSEPHDLYPRVQPQRGEAFTWTKP